MKNQHYTIHDSELHDSDNEFVYQQALTKKLDDYLGDFDQHVLNEIVLWKVNRYAAFDSETIDLINKITPESDKMDIRLTEEVLRKLLNTKGVGLPMASAILRFRNPKIYQVIDQRVYRCINDHELNLPVYNNEKNCEILIDLYLSYLNKLREVCNEYSIEFSKSDRILYMMDKRVNKEIKLKSY